MKEKGHKFFENVKTYWTNMISPTKWVMSMYMPLLAKMAENNSSLLIAKVHFGFLCNVNLLIFLIFCCPCWKQSMH
jgi:hypothetical protein